MILGTEKNSKNQKKANIRVTDTILVLKQYIKKYYSIFSQQRMIKKYNPVVPADSL